MQRQPVRQDATAAANIRAAVTLALWSAAWRSGASADRVLSVLADVGVRAGVRAEDHETAVVSGLPGPGQPSGSSVDLLTLLRRGGGAGLLLPVPGDMRGLPVHGPATAAALASGVAVVLPAAGVSLAPAHGQWRALACGPEHATLPVREARQLVDGAVAEATDVLVRADVASRRRDPRAAVAEAIAADEVTIPPGTPSAASSLLARATTLAALLSVAATHETAAVTSREMDIVDGALAPLHAAVKEARRTAVAAAVAALGPDGLAASRPAPSPAAQRPVR
jgi:hypothetical protein